MSQVELAASLKSDAAHTQKDVPATTLPEVLAATVREVSTTMPQAATTRLACHGSAGRPAATLPVDDVRVCIRVLRAIEASPDRDARASEPAPSSKVYDGAMAGPTRHSRLAPK